MLFRRSNSSTEERFLASSASSSACWRLRSSTSCLAAARSLSATWCLWSALAMASAVLCSCLTCLSTLWIALSTAWWKMRQVRTRQEEGAYLGGLRGGLVGMLEVLDVVLEVLKRAIVENMWCGELDRGQTFSSAFASFAIIFSICLASGDRVVLIVRVVRGS
jgi:hypothetical protein